MMSETRSQTVVVAGASGFIGRGLPAVLGDDYQLVGLSREPSEAAPRSPEAYRWRRCDLFSRRRAFEALAGADLAVYLVHSMIPSAALSQGEYVDMDLICADNFARAADHHDVDHIVYVGELAGDQSCEPSRCGEIQSVLGAYGPTLTEIRAGFVVGPGGAGTQMLFRLVDRLAVMLLPTWTSSHVWPIARADLVELIAWVLAHPEETEGTFEVGGPERTTYRQMLAMVSEVTGRGCRFFRVPTEAPGLSARWISGVTGQPLSLVRPLVERFRHDLDPGERRLQKMAGQQPMDVRDGLKWACTATEPETEAAPPVPVTEQETGLARTDEPNVVRSVQRLVLPRGRTTRWIAREYARWLPGFMGPLMRATYREGVVRLFVRWLPWPMLVLELDDEISNPDHRLFWIRGGLLVTPHPGARLEFRRIPNRRAVLTAIHGYRPRLPWLIYILTQARVHHFVMQKFGRHLAQLDRRLEEKQQLQE